MHSNAKRAMAETHKKLSATSLKIFSAEYCRLVAKKIKGTKIMEIKTDLNDIQSKNGDIRLLLEILRNGMPDCNTGYDLNIMDKISLLVDFGIRLVAERDKLINAVFYNQRVDNAVVRQSTTKTQ